MRLYKKTIILFLFFFGILWGQTAPKRYIYKVDSLTIRSLFLWEYHQGDDKWGLEPASGDSIQIIRSYLFRPESGQIHWYRIPIQINKTLDHQRVLLRFEGIHAAYEIFWDGELIDQNGNVGKIKAEEQPGDFIRKIVMKKEWLKPGGRSYLEVEELVSRRLRENFTYCCFRVDLPEERDVLERGLIALIAQHPVGTPSAKWLGKHAASEKIVQSGLWNTQHIAASSLTSEQLRRIEELSVSYNGK